MHPHPPRFRRGLLCSPSQANILGWALNCSLVSLLFCYWIPKNSFYLLLQGWPQRIRECIWRISQPTKMDYHLNRWPLYLEQNLPSFLSQCHVTLVLVIEKPAKKRVCYCKFFICSFNSKGLKAHNRNRCHTHLLVSFLKCWLKFAPYDFPVQVIFTVRG